MTCTPALAGQRIDAAVAALRTDPVYVDPTAELAIGSADQSRLRQTIDSAGAGPVYIAILPLAAENETGGDPDGVLQALHDGLGRPGTYAAVVGRHFRAGSEGVLPQGVAGRLATEALNAHRGDGVTATLVDFVHRVAAAQQSGGADGDGNDEPGTGGGVLIGLLVFGAVAFLVTRAVRNRRRSQAELAEVKAAAHDDLIALADDVQNLEQPVESNTDAKREYDAALENYDQATHAYDRATRRPPCFFDPRHGPSTRDVEWAPPGGTPRKVPACEADAQAVERGDEPASRQVLVGGRSMPYWNAPPYFGPWAGGYFMPFGGMGFLSGLFVGELLGGAYGGWGYGSWAGSGSSGGFGSWSDAGGGSGSSDFGGGMDFGGGDFGGGGGGGDF